MATVVPDRERAKRQARSEPEGTVTPRDQTPDMETSPSRATRLHPAGRDSGPDREPGAINLIIDCDDCVMQHTEACADCVVSFICSREPGDAVVVDVGEFRALKMLSDSGLVPELRHRRRIS